MVILLQFTWVVDLFDSLKDWIWDLLLWFTQTLVSLLLWMISFMLETVTTLLEFFGSLLFDSGDTMPYLSNLYPLYDVLNTVNYFMPVGEYFILFLFMANIQLIGNILHFIWEFIINIIP